MALKGKRHFTYANVASTAALVIALAGGGAAVAATVLPANSVGTAQLKTGAVTNPKIANYAVNSAKIASNSISNAKIANGAVGNSKLGSGSITANKFGSGTVGVVRGYAWNNQASPTLNTPISLSNGYTFNSSGGAVTLTRTGTGLYTVAFPGLNLAPGTVLVNTYGPSNSANCHVSNWSPSAVNVACYDTSGAAVDSRFTIAVIR